MILIGSKAIRIHFPDFPREPKDTDYIVRSHKTFPEKQPGVEYFRNPIFDDYDYSFLFPSELATLKASHLCWDIFWEKNMWDLQWLLKKGCKIDWNLFWKLYNYWNEYHSKNKRSDLKMSKEEFFDNAINYNVAEHDDLHKLINPIPLYTRVLKDGAEVELDELKFINLSHEDKIDFVKEEIYVMAWERYKSLGYKHAYGRMLKKFILSHAPLFSLPFILENYTELSNPKKIINYIKQINDGLQITK